MSHLDEGALHALLDGEVPSAEITELNVHLERCPECRGRLAEAREFRSESLEMVGLLDLDLAPAGVLADPAGRSVPVGPAVATRAAPAAAGPGVEAKRRPATRFRWRTPLAWAATVALAVSSGYFLGAAELGTRINPGPAADLAVAAPAPEPPAPLEDREQTPAKDPAPLPSRATPPSPGRAAAAPSAERERRAAGRQEAASETLAAADRDAAAKSAPRADVSREQADAAQPAPPPAPAPAPTRASPEPVRTPLRRLAPSSFALDEVVTTGRPSGNDALAKVVATELGGAQSIDAIRVLGGRLRLLDGMVPVRIEVVDALVRVHYRTEFGPLVLEQRRAADSVATHLVAPPGAPRDSLLAWERRVR